MAFANLAMLCGKIGVEGGGVNPLRGQNNVQGACDMGGLPDVFPGYQKVADEARAKVRKGLGRDTPRQAGMTVVEIMNAAHEGKIKALYIMGENPLLSDPNLTMWRQRSSAWISWWSRTSSSRKPPPGRCGPALRLLCGEGRHIHQHRAAGPAGPKGSAAAR